MTQDEIIRMAREVDAITGLIGRWIFLDAAHLERFAALVAAHERELCAKVCEEYDAGDDYGCGYMRTASMDCAAAIRAREETSAVTKEIPYAQVRASFDRTDR